MDDLALARACADGDPLAWECFVSRYGSTLHSTAMAITHDEGAARELANSLWAELFGIRTGPQGARISKLTSYTGRGSLESWLKAVLAQEYVNRYRANRFQVRLDDHLHQFQAPNGLTQPYMDTRLEDAAEEALSNLDAEEKLLLAMHYLDGRTLGQIGRLLGLHESTVSRRINKITTSLRKRIVRTLCRNGMSRQAAQEALQSDVRDLAINVRAHLLHEVTTGDA